MLNEATLIGNLTRDVQHVDAKDGAKTRAVLNVATDTFWYTEGKRRQRTDFHRVVVFGPQADRVKGFPKGQQVLVQGRLQTRSYDQNGDTRYITEVLAHRIERLGAKASPEPLESDLPEPGAPDS